MNAAASTPFPVKPTTIPQARKYTRTFKAGEGRVFTEEDQITIEIPPIANTYLTKDARIYFKFNFGFKDHSFTGTGPEPAKNWWGAGTTNEVSPFNIMRKPVPMLDTCGPYGFFRDVEVYDYLGNTLLEKVTRHDLLASILADFYLDPELDRLRPPTSENQSTSANYVNPVSTNTEINKSAPLMRTLGSPGIHTRYNGINLLDSLLNDYLAGGKSVVNYYQYIMAPPTQNATEVKVPTWRFSISLLNFLGRGSSNFVPLHNGYRIVLKLNPARIPIRFGLPNGPLRMLAKNDLDPPKSTNAVYVDIKPQITQFELFDVSFRADLLEVTPDLDAQIDKTVRSRMNAYNILGRCDKPTIIPGNYMSVNNIKMSMRHLEYPDDPTDSFSVLGFRSRTFVDKARLLYNDAIQQEYKNVDEMRIALGPDFDPLISPLAFSADRPNQFEFGTGGYIYPYPGQDFRWQVSEFLGLPVNYQWVNQKSYVQEGEIPAPSPLNTFFTRFNDQAGKFLLVFDLALSGYNENTITSIDTTKTTLKVHLEREEDYPLPFETDIFIEHDAIITIKPGQYSTVSF